MVIDVSFFGYGVGLVLLGWLVGACVGVAIRAFSSFGG